ncbi:hypothetical protein RAS1_24060 [Phycisphaerae bacterium RAS1]|nr:hypothetical protein RAS1_24060 [Phycisphaerae bacterium RAS1]
MDYYHVWFNLKDTHKDIEFADRLHAFLGHLRQEAKIAGYRLTRRKLGFGPSELGEFHVIVDVQNLTQLDGAFGLAATRSGRVQELHAHVYEMVTDFRSALYRDFPDPQRAHAAPRGES